MLATCSPKTIAGRHSLMRWCQAGHRCRSSANPPPLPAALKGWHGHDPVHTERVVRPSGKAQGVGPTADPGKKVALIVAFQIERRYVFNAAFIDFTFCNMAAQNESAQPFRRFRIILVVVGGQN